MKTLKQGLCLQTFISLKARFPFPVVGNPLFQHFVLIKRSMVRAPVVLRRLSLLQSHIVVHKIVIHCRHSHPESEKYKSMCARNDQKWYLACLRIPFTRCPFVAKLSETHRLEPNSTQCSLIANCRASSITWWIKLPVARIFTSFKPRQQWTPLFCWWN